MAVQRCLSVTNGNPKFYFFPEPDGSQLVEIDLGESLAEFFFDFEVERSTAVAVDGGMYRTTTTHRQILNIQRDRFSGGEDLAIKSRGASKPLGSRLQLRFRC